MTAMPTIQTPEGFLLECQRRGIKLTAQGGTIKATGKPPANPEKFAAFLKAKKPELLALLSGGELREVAGTSEASEMGNPMGFPSVGKLHGALAQRGNPIPTHETGKSYTEALPLRADPSPMGNPMELSESGKSHGATPELWAEVPVSKQYSASNNSSPALYSDQRQEVLSWALDQARAGLLPEPLKPIKLPSGQCVPALGAAAWLLAGQAQAQETQPTPEAIQRREAHALAWLRLRQDLRLLAIACADGWHTVYPVIEGEAPQ